MSDDITIGPVFETGWEQKPGIDECLHEWLPVRYRPYPGAKADTVQKCERCGVPRCGRSNGSGYCIDRRHHDSVHIYPDGEFEPLGGVVPADTTGERP
jgi:hypothetical protein